MRYLGYRDVWENCYFSTYGRDAALRYGERCYCLCGMQYFVRNNQLISADQVRCYDWHKCKGLHEVVSKKGKDKVGKRKSPKH